MSEEVWNQDESSRVVADKDGKIHMEHLFQDGFRTGVSKGQEESVQIGFDIGYSEAIKRGKEWGNCHGVVATYEALKAKIEDPEFKSKMENLNQQMKGISSQDVYISVYNNLVDDKIEEFKASGGHQVVPEYIEHTRSKKDIKSTMESIQNSIKDLDS